MHTQETVNFIVIILSYFCPIIIVTNSIKNLYANVTTVIIKGWY